MGLDYAWMVGRYKQKLEPGGYMQAEASTELSGWNKAQTAAMPRTLRVTPDVVNAVCRQSVKNGINSSPMFFQT